MKYLLLPFIFLHAYQKSTDPHYFIWFPICLYPLLRLLELSSWLCSYHCQAQNSLCFLNAYRINSKLHISYEVLVTDLYPLIQVLLPNTKHYYNVLDDLVPSLNYWLLHAGLWNFWLQLFCFLGHFTQKYFPILC